MRTRKSPFYRVFFSFIFILACFLVVNFAKSVSNYYENRKEQIATLSDIDANKIINERGNTISAGEVKGELDQRDEGTVSSSENFKIKQLAFGADVVVANSGDEGSLEVSDIRSESFMSNKKDEVRLIISWKTSKLAMSSVEYAKNTGQSPKIIKEDSYGFTHSVSIDGLEQSTPYVYKIKCRDRWGNEYSSEYFGIYSASRPVSVFDMISGAMNETFGWTVAGMKK